MHRLIHAVHNHKADISRSLDLVRGILTEQADTETSLNTLPTEDARSSLRDNHKTDILEKLRQRAAAIGYGSLTCELQIHQGQIKQVEITGIKEKLRADTI